MKILAMLGYCLMMLLLTVGCNKDSLKEQSDLIIKGNWSVKTQPKGYNALEFSFDETQMGIYTDVNQDGILEVIKYDYVLKVEGPRVIIKVDFNLGYGLQYWGELKLSRSNHQMNIVTAYHEFIFFKKW